MSNYPPGVTGREFEISGPDEEWSETVTCENPDCGVTTMMDCWSHHDRGAWAECPECGEDTELVDNNEPDWDAIAKEIAMGD